MASTTEARPRRFAPCLLLLCLALAWPAAARAWLRHADLPDVPSVTSLVATPLAQAGEAAPAQVFGLLTTPPGWVTGDAAVMTIGGRFPATGRQYGLVEALLAEGAAVLELDLEAARGGSQDSGAVAEPSAPEEMQAEIFGALAALRTQERPGPVVLIGLDSASGAALLAAGPAESARRLPPGVPGFAAAVALGSGDAAFRAGAPLPAEEGWPRRVTLFCEAIAWVLAGDGAAAPLAARCIAEMRPLPAARRVVLAPD